MRLRFASRANLNLASVAHHQMPPAIPRSRAQLRSLAFGRLAGT